MATHWPGLAFVQIDMLGSASFLLAIFLLSAGLAIVARGEVQFATS